MSEEIRAARPTHTLKERAIDEGWRFLVMFLYLWVLFGLFVLNERVILQQRGIGFSSQGFALINALILAKVMLVAEDLRLGRGLSGKPLIYPILYQSLVFAALFLGFHVLEHVVVGWFHGEALAASVPAIGGGGFAGLVCVTVIIFIALMPFFAVKTLDPALGRGRLRALLFGKA